MSIEEIKELYRIALTWTNGDQARAEMLMKRYLQGSNESVMVRP